MQLSEIFEYLMYGELANLVFSSIEEGEIKEKDRARLISNINLGLIDLHKRFPISYKALGIELFEHIGEYVLDRKYSYTMKDPSVRYHYIMDNPQEPFNNDLIKINRVLTEDGEEEYPLNAEDNNLSLFTPSYNILQVPYPIYENILMLEYQAYPAKIPLNVPDPSDYYVALPEVFLEPLISFINFKLYTGVGVEKPEAPNYLQRYDIECKRIADLGLFNQDVRANLKLEDNQWV